MAARALRCKARTTGTFSSRRHPRLPDGLDEAFAGALEAALEQGVIEDASIAASLEQRADFWQLRECLSDAQSKEGGSIKHDVSVAVGLVPTLDQGGDARGRSASRPGARVVAFGHLGDGNIHFNVSQPVGADKQAFLDRWDAMNEIVHEIVARLGGSYSAEHGVGQLKRGLACAMEGPCLARDDAPDQGGARSERRDESGQGSLRPSRLTPCP